MNGFWERNFRPNFRDEIAINRELENLVTDACESGNWNVVKESFLDLGFDVNSYLSSGWTLLMSAASFSQTELVRQLLNHGANPNLYHEGYTPLMALSSSVKEEPDERMRCLECLLEFGADVNMANKLRETALIFACKKQEPDFVLKLLEHGAVIDFSDTQEWTPLFYAVAENRLEIVQLLIDKGADRTLKNYEGLDAYNIAILKGHERLIPLLDVGRPVDIANVMVHSIIHWKDMFPKMSKLQEDEIDDHVDSMLYGMGLNSYKKFFCGMDLTTFLNLQEEDLIELGVDLKLHRDKFVEGLIKFHKHEWNNKLVKPNIAQNFSTFEAIKILGNINKHLNVLSGSIYFSKRYLDQIEQDKEINFDDSEREKIKEEITRMRLAMLNIKDATVKIKKIAEYVKSQSSDLSLPIFIGKKKEYNNSNNKKWVLLMVISVSSIFLLKMKSAKRLTQLGNNALTNALCHKFNLVSLFLQKSYNVF